MLHMHLTCYCSSVMNHACFFGEYTHTSCHTLSRKKILIPASACIWMDPGFLHQHRNCPPLWHHCVQLPQQEAACDCFFCAGTGPGYWHTSCHIPNIGRQGLAQTWVCISSWVVFILAFTVRIFCRLMTLSSR